MSSFAIVHDTESSSSGKPQTESGAAQKDNIAHARDEMALYQSTRCMTSPAAMYRIFALPMHKQLPSVQPLVCHLEDQQYVRFKAADASDMTKALQNNAITKLTAWFHLKRSREK